MASSPAASMRRSQGSLVASSKHSHDDEPDSEYTSIDTLVNHLLVAKRSLSSMTLVLRANELATAARHAHEDAAILAAQAGFLRTATLDQTAILVRVRRSLQATYNWGKRDFRKTVKAMDVADMELGATMEMLRKTDVQNVFRQKGEDRKNLLDFVDEGSVHGMRDAMKRSIEEMQGIQQSYDGDLLRFDTDIRSLKQIMLDSPLPPSYDDRENSWSAMTELLARMIDNSANMAQLLTSLTKHFDMCVTAIRTTEGAVALARRKAAEVTQLQGDNGVSISGVIAEQESNLSDLEPKTPKDRAEMLKVVTQDAQEVEDVVQEIQERLAVIEEDYAALEAHTEHARSAYAGILEAYAVLAEIGDRLGDYLAAEEDFKMRWDIEREAVEVKIQEMRRLRDFYEGYASAYDSLILEVERRRGVDDRVKNIWRKAQENVDKILDADRVARETFRQDVGEFLPTDLWAGMQGPARRWAVVPIREDGEVDDGELEQSNALRRSIIEAARSRLGKSASESR